MSKIITCLILTILTPGNVLSDYWSDRNAVLADEASRLIGSSIQLSEDEQRANDVLMAFKRQEYDEGFQDPSKFLASRHFFEVKEAIEQSEVFKFIRRMPKGASLHSHSSAMLSLEGLIGLTYMDGLYGCDNGTFYLSFIFGSIPDDCLWKPLAQWREEDSNFDEFLKTQFSLIVDDPQSAYGDINAVWSKFESIFTVAGSLFDYRQFLHDFIYQVLQEFYDDNVRYLEIRAGTGTTFDSNNNIYDESLTYQLYLDTIVEFIAEHPDFLGLRHIYARGRRVENDSMASHIEEYFTYRDQFPSLIAGFDLVGQEDLGRPLSDFADQLLAISDRTEFFFHAGETNWYGSSTDLNLVDAILLNTSRIGHAFAITKHPQILEIVKERDIALEINPLSNQVLKLVDDLRNHVGTYLIANDFPVVITCDDPGFWGAKGVSYDWYMAFMAMTPRDGDLRILKQLVWNSIIYSSMSAQETESSLVLLEGWWDDFIQEVIATYY